ncbi:MAG: hypothetical protein QNK37_01815 [Acidobacteriota bacterium]|nr:hypothetical protein [Acidobacteriota bacterium]
MRTEKDHLQAALEEAMPVEEASLSAEVLAAYEAGALPPDEMERVREQLLVNDEAAEALLDLHALENPVSEPAQSDLVDQSWQSFQKQIEVTGASAPDNMVPFKKAAPKRIDPWMGFSGILAAACVVLAALGLFQHRKLSLLESPQVIHRDLVSDTPREWEPVAFASEAIVLRINIPSMHHNYKAYYFLLSDPDGNLLLRSGRLRLIDGYLTYQLLRGQLPENRSFRLEIEGERDGTVSKLGSIVF